ncbi:TonB-linked outer membrane protein, SusC/RagA family [Mucilaginibacter mallensis]|uniref:TonB-linked outer membrane protein, SusC/RagA family n=1 Tax=Mucilaginibacter mallensis TaxID=652787 RepID=A0A1H1MNP7_MUCMA|nr:TonB-dependent receptor [Mucilaginibacter mallensis]SDR88252.1 TonB-linked outer membrane protein, SusC/RagA family [Mucilaginibacter mallensis]
MTKLTFILMLLTFMDVSAKVYSQDTKISLSVENVTLSKALKAIEAKSTYQFFYSNSHFPADKNITLNVKDVSVKEVLTNILAKTTYTYHLLGNQIIVIADKNVKSSPIVIKGKVVDEKGIGLPGVNIHIKGTTTGISTSSDGSYQITVPTENTILVYSFVGYKSQEITPNGQYILNINLVPESGSLNEVLVVGYGTQKKSDILGAVASFDAKNIEDKPLDRVEQALIGEMAGVQVRQQTGMPGVGLSILVRGTGSITAGNEPLYVIDGFPLEVSSQNSNGTFTNNPLNNINPADIESVQVLKDAAAGAIYGSRAANGVVIITTKRGQTGKVKINFNANTGVSSVSKKLDVLSAQEWIEQATDVENTNWVASGAGRTADQTSAERAAILGLTNGAVNINYMSDPRWTEPGHPGLTYVDWQDEVFRKALFENYNLSASGGTENVKYFISGNYLNQNGTLINSNYLNYGMRANVEANASKKIKFGINLAPTYSINNAPPAEGKDNQLMKLAQMVPIVESSTGINTGAYGNPTYAWASAKLVSPYTYLKSTVNEIKISRLLGTAYAEYDVLPGLAIKSTVNYDGISQTTKTYIPDYVVTGAASSLTTNPGLYSSGSYTVLSQQDFLNENTISYNKTIANKHTISAVAGVSYNIVHDETVGLATAGGYANDIITTLNNAIPTSAGATYTGTNTESNNTLFSYYSRLQYGYEDKYLISGTIRRDASSKFGADNRWGTFPSASVGWRISKESFFDDIKPVSDLKLRFSWGESGNNNIGNYNSVPTLSSANYNFGGNTPISATGQVVSGLANPYLKWETSTTYNAGLDASFFAGRINLTVDAYNKKNSDLLLNLPVLAASGFTTSLQNIGAVVNKGLEISLNTVNIRRQDFQWSMNANIAFNKNTVTALGPGNATIQIASAYSGSNAPYLLEKGLPEFSYYVTKVEGILTAADIANPKVAKIAGEMVGDPKYYDANGDGVINANDRVVDGHPNPNYTWGWTNTFRYHDFDLSILVYGQQGGSILSYFGRAIDVAGSTSQNILGVWNDRWTPQNQNYSAPRGKLDPSYTVPYVTSDWIYSTDFIRIQNITLGYNLKKLFPDSKAISAARIYFSLENYFGHDKYKGGVNPEAQNTNVSGNSSYALPGDYGSMPLSKTASLGVNFSF